MLKMSRLAELISRTLKEFKVKKKVDEYNFERIKDDDGWDIVTYTSNSNDDEKTRERIEKLNTHHLKLQKEKEKGSED
jgi:hypothetical protein